MSLIFRPPSYTIAGTRVKNPDSFDYEWYRLTENGRLATGDMVMDSIAVKRKFNFSYDVMSHVELTKIRKVLFGSSTVFYSFQFVEDNETTTVTVYAGALKYRKFRTGSLWHYRDVTFSLIER